MDEGGSSSPDFEALTNLLRGQIPALDGVRGSAILLLLMHQLLLPTRPTGKPLQVVELALQAGWVGVQLFFVLSGFLITGILLETRGKKSYFRAFYMRRVLRIFPLYYIFLITTAFILPRLVTVPPSLSAEPSRLGLYWVYLSNWKTGGPEPLGHTWSLSVEEQFYFVWPLIVAITPPRILLRLCGAVAILSLGYRVFMRVTGGDPDLVYQVTIARIDALVMGSAVAVALRDPRLSAWLALHARRLLAVSAVVLALVALATKGLPRENIVTQTAGYSLIALVGSLLVATMVVEVSRGGGRIARVFEHRALREAGKYSYAIYILQLPVHLWLSRVIVASWVEVTSDQRWAIVQPLYMIAVTLLLFGLARLSYVLIEKPFLGLKRYFKAA